MYEETPKKMTQTVKVEEVSGAMGAEEVCCGPCEGRTNGEDRTPPPETRDVRLCDWRSETAKLTDTWGCPNS